VATLALFPLCRIGTAADTANADEWVKANMPSLVDLYQHLHQTPELSEKEKETSARMAQELEAVGAKVNGWLTGH
jgi:metal-dependent amidase/aminoacylase/carboxypeptidase family protein